MGFQTTRAPGHEQRRGSSWSGGVATGFKWKLRSPIWRFIKHKVTNTQGSILLRPGCTALTQICTKVEGICDKVFYLWCELKESQNSMLSDSVAQRQSSKKKKTRQYHSIHFIWRQYFIISDTARTTTNASLLFDGSKQRKLSSTDRWYSSFGADSKSVYLFFDKPVSYYNFAKFGLKVPVWLLVLK